MPNQKKGIVRKISRAQRETARYPFRGEIVSPKRRYEYIRRLAQTTSLLPEQIAHKSGASIDFVHQVIEREILGLDEQLPRLLDNPHPRFKKGPVSAEQGAETQKTSRQTEKYLKSLLPHARLMPPGHKTYDLELRTRRGVITIDAKQSRHLIKDSFLPVRCMANGTIPKEWPFADVYAIVAFDGIVRVRGKWLRQLINQHPGEIPVLRSKNRYHLFVRVQELINLRVGKKIGYIGDTTTSGIKVPRPGHFPAVPAAPGEPESFLGQPRPTRIPPAKRQ